MQYAISFMSTPECLNLVMHTNFTIPFYVL